MDIMGDWGIDDEMRCRSSMLSPRGRLPITLSATKLLFRLALPKDCHLALSSCAQVNAGSRESCMHCCKGHLSVLLLCM